MTKTVKKTATKAKATRTKTKGPEWVLTRGRDQGVHFGILVNDGASSGWVVLDECRRIWSWEGATELSEVSVYGIKSGHVSVTVRPKRLRYTDVCEILPLSDAALKNLQSFEEWRART
jgi:hypothetical protein